MNAGRERNKRYFGDRPTTLGCLSKCGIQPKIQSLSLKLSRSPQCPLPFRQFLLLTMSVESELLPNNTNLVILGVQLCPYLPDMNTCDFVVMKYLVYEKQAGLVNFKDFVIDSFSKCRKGNVPEFVTSASVLCYCITPEGSRSENFMH
ncbi:hypothetical protein TNIN_222301 [Trichonephila inaurata madagascariensis]|uniref:Uncharacterized protein n=1 Tax=Trichonephila inaurata madagascariensis TaxID=2747483 RepID=A0A8X7C5M1_9ARAC|nr:hypothetical protein TNIN_222301 [Trichonephila inaurata madagascariensis]